MGFERVKKRRKTKARKEDCCERPAPSNKMQLQKGKEAIAKKEGSKEEKEGSRPPGSKNETLNPNQKTKAQEMHYVSWYACLRPAGSHGLCFLGVRGLLTAFVFLSGNLDEAGRAVVAL